MFISYHEGERASSCSLDFTETMGTRINSDTTLPIFAGERPPSAFTAPNQSNEERRFFRPTNPIQSNQETPLTYIG